MGEIHEIPKVAHKAKPHLTQDLRVAWLVQILDGEQEGSLLLLYPRILFAGEMVGVVRRHCIGASTGRCL
jgi:hypothetical protein